jgi:hypothetical protein
MSESKIKWRNAGGFGELDMWGVGDKEWIQNIQFLWEGRGGISKNINLKAQRSNFEDER